MLALIKGWRAFSYLAVTLEEGEKLLMSPAGLVSFDAELNCRGRFRGGIWRAWLARLLGGEPVYLAEMTNLQSRPCNLTLTHAMPGEIVCAHLYNHGLCLQAGAFIAATSGIHIYLKYAGITSWLAKEGLFRTCVSGSGTIWFGAAGPLLETDVESELVIENHRLVSYDASLQLSHRMEGKLLAQLLGGDGLSTRIHGVGKVVIQMRSLAQVAQWIEQR